MSLPGLSRRRPSTSCKATSVSVGDLSGIRFEAEQGSEDRVRISGVIRLSSTSHNEGYVLQLPVVLGRRNVLYQRI